MLLQLEPEISEFEYLIHLFLFSFGYNSKTINSLLLYKKTFLPNSLGLAFIEKNFIGLNEININFFYFFVKSKNQDLLFFLTRIFLNQVVPGASIKSFKKLSNLKILLYEKIYNKNIKKLFQKETINSLLFLIVMKKFMLEEISKSLNIDKKIFFKKNINFLDVLKNFSSINKETDIREIWILLIQINLLIKESNLETEYELKKFFILLFIEKILNIIFTIKIDTELR